MIYSYEHIDDAPRQMEVYLIEKYFPESIYKAITAAFYFKAVSTPLVMQIRVVGLLVILLTTM